MNKKERKRLAEFYLFCEKQYNEAFFTPVEDINFEVSGRQTAAGTIKREFTQALRDMGLDYHILLNEFNLWDEWMKINRVDEDGKRVMEEA